MAQILAFLHEISTLLAREGTLLARGHFGLADRPAEETADLR